LTGSHSESTVPVATKGVGNDSSCYVTKVTYGIHLVTGTGPVF